MAKIRVDIDDALLEMLDRVAAAQRVTRSALIREALRAHLKTLRFEELERQERLAHQRQPDDLVEVARWERVADWPDD